MKAISNLKKYRFLLIELVKKDIKLKYRRSYLGLFWTLLEPILTTLVLTFVFSSLLKRTNDTCSYPVYILIGRLTYSLFSTGTKSAMRSIRKNSSMIKKVYVPKYIYPLSSVLSNFVIFLLSLIVLVGACIVQNVPFTVYVFEMVFPLIVVLILALGVGFILASLSVFFKDIEYLWDVALMLIMYCSAIFYSVDPASNLGRVIVYNPLYCIISNLRNAILIGQHLDLFGMVYSTVFSVVTLGIGLFIFRKTQDKFILHI